MFTRFKMHSRKKHFSTLRVFNNFDCLTCVQTPSKLMMLMCLPIIFIMSISETRSIMSLSVWPSFNIFTATMFPWVPVLIKLATSALTTLKKNHSSFIITLLYKSMKGVFVVIIFQNGCRGKDIIGSNFSFILTRKIEIFSPLKYFIFVIMKCFINLCCGGCR